jgi:hypothetical protein
MFAHSVPPPTLPLDVYAKTWSCQQTAEAPN